MSSFLRFSLSVLHDLYKELTCVFNFLEIALQQNGKILGRLIILSYFSFPPISSYGQKTWNGVGYTCIV